MELEEAEELQRIYLEALARIETYASGVASELGLTRLGEAIGADIRQVERQLRELADRRRAAEEQRAGGKR